MTVFKKITSVVGAAALVSMAAACDVDVEEEGELPDVDISAEGGEMPDVDADVADVDVGSEEVMVEVPTVDVGEADASAEDDD